MVNLPGNALGGGPGFWFKINKFPVLMLPHVCAPISTGEDGVGHELAVCSHRHLTDALGPIPVCCHPSPSTSWYFIITITFRKRPTSVTGVLQEIRAACCRGQQRS